MIRLLSIWFIVIALPMLALWSDEELPPSDNTVAPPKTVVEARARARLLHELAHGALQVMHRDFFDEDDAHAIPSSSLEDVFVEIEKSYQVQLKWLVVNTDVVNVDHEPETPFERFAVKKLSTGRPYVEEAINDRYQFAGAIRLASQCLKCHVKRRTDNRDRVAGLVITMPLRSNSNN